MLNRKLIGDLRRQRGAFFAVWLTVVLGLAFYGSTYPAGIAMIDSFRATYDKLNYADFAMRFDLATEDDVLPSVNEVAGVELAEGRLVMDAGIALDDVSRLTLRTISLPESGHPAVNDIIIQQGEAITTADEILILESFANFHDIEVGDVVNVWMGDEPHTLTVAGLVFAPEYLVAGQSPIMPFPQPNSFGVAYMNYDDMVDRFGINSGSINEVVLSTVANADEAVVRAGLQAIATDIGQEYVYSRAQTASGGVVDANIDGNMAIAAFFSAMFLLIGGLVMAVLLARLMDAEKRRIGTMRALGLSEGEALRHYLGYPIIIAVSGGIVGSIFGYLSSFGVATYFIQNIAGGSLPEFVNTPQWNLILLGFAITLVLAILASLYPTWRASGTPPGLALRPVTPKGMGAQARITLPGVPLVIQQALRNMLRVPARTLNTLVGVVLGVMVILSAGGLADSTVRNFEVQFPDGLKYDLQVTWEAILPETVYRQAAEELPGVSEVEMQFSGPVTASFGENSLDTSGIAIAEGTDFYTFATLEGDDLLAHSDGVWIGHNLARVLDAGIGDTISLTTLGQTQAAEVAGIFEQSVGSMVFIPAPLMQSWTPGGIQLGNGALLRTEAGAIDETRRALNELDGVLAIEVADFTIEDIGNYMELYINFSYVFQMFGYLLTLVVIFNTVSINLRERHEELMIMRSMGARLREIAATVTWETLIVVSLATLIGILIGLSTLTLLLENYNLDFYGMLETVFFRTYVLAVVGMVLVIAIAEWLSLRGLRKDDLGQLSKSLSM